MSEVEKLENRLREMGVKTLHPFYGPEAHKLTQEQLAAEMNKVLDQLENGELTEIYDLEYGLEFDSQEQCDRFYTLYPQPTWTLFGQPADDETQEWRNNMNDYEEKLQLRHAEFMQGEKRSNDNGL
jgi:hypothetical protein